MGEFFQNMWGRFAAWLFSGSMNRARFFVEKFAQHLTVGETMLDLGCGTGHLGVYSAICHGQKVTLADVKPHWGYIGQWLFGVPCAMTLARRHELPYVVYNGRELPFADGAFDTVLVAFVLHHADNPDVVLAEAVRVARKRIVVFEDIPHTRSEARLNLLADAVVNLEVAGHPHGNRTQTEWEMAFRSHGLRVFSIGSWTSKLLIFPFPNTMFVLEK